ncbi:DUF4439 domain-containing protein [Actinomadura flavalba]|uniref:DUF4439 domain-containing protein n=1 Tax=Actinomadura flavalba TaxID=1120938 RepID=UPI000381A0CE|nr:DUF4439 domain-containing protein [Actinomadura flavalba]
MSTRALAEALKAEHAAVHGYGVVGARLRPPSQRTAMDGWNAHRAARDALAARLAAAGAPVPAAAPVYRLPVEVTSARTAAGLAAALEDDVVRAYAGLAGSPDAGLRTLAARTMQEAATRAVEWRRRAGAPAAAPAFPGLPAGALAPKPQPGDA